MWANRQELPQMYRFNGGVVAGKTEHIENYNEYNIDNLNYSKTRVGYVTMPTDRAHDIDTLRDFELAELLMKDGERL
jgi:N-acylneuraminate cytidylyltransferase/CMP-N,N'-diacetyllegionaminic acid synthase